MYQNNLYCISTSGNFQLKLVFLCDTVLTSILHLDPYCKALTFLPFDKALGSEAEKKNFSNDNYN